MLFDVAKTEEMVGEEKVADTLVGIPIHTATSLHRTTFSNRNLCTAAVRQTRKYNGWNELRLALMTLSLNRSFLDFHSDHVFLRRTVLMLLRTNA